MRVRQLKTRLDESVAEKLEHVPASLRVIETARLKCACPHCHAGIVEAAGPPQTIEKSLAPEGLLAHLVVSKYIDHLPLYRLERSFLRQGDDLSRGTLCGWVADVAAALTPIGDELRRQVAVATYLQTDDTRSRCSSRRAEPQRAIGRQVVFDATPTHERDGPETLLAPFARDLEADAYTAYDALYATGRMREIGCWAHAPRLCRGAHHRRARGTHGRLDPPALSGRTRQRRSRRRCASGSPPRGIGPAPCEIAPSATSSRAQCCRNRRRAIRSAI
jgi:transposase